MVFFEEFSSFLFFYFLSFLYIYLYFLCKKKKNSELKHVQALEEALEELKSQTVSLTLFEQLQMINIVDEYVSHFKKGKVRIDPNWEKGFSVECETTVTDVDKQLYRSNVEVFYQQPQSIEKKCSFFVSLVKYPEDTWRVLQVKYSDDF